MRRKSEITSEKKLWDGLFVVEGSAPTPDYHQETLTLVMLQGPQSCLFTTGEGDKLTKKKQQQKRRGGYVECKGGRG